MTYLTFGRFDLCLVTLIAVFLSFLHVASPSKGNKKDPDQYDLRLRDGHAEYEGRLEIYYGGHWGTICGLGWSDHEGNVACKQLGFYGVFEVQDATSFGEGTGPILLEDVLCTEDKTRLVDCWHSDWYVYDCDKKNVVGLRCLVNQPPDSLHEVRLVDGYSIFEGRIEIFYNGNWGTVCSDGWDKYDAAVVCRQLQFGPPKSSRQFFGFGTGDVLLSSAACFGYESRLLECVTQTTIQMPGSCTHENDVGVMCNNPSDSFPLSITGGATPYEGSLSLYYHGQFGTLCPRDWDMQDAEVACRQLGYGPPPLDGGELHKALAKSHAYFVLDDIQCRGGEEFLAACSHPLMGQGGCHHGNTVSVRCSEPDIQDYLYQLRLVGGRSNYEGLLEMYYQGKWGAICSTHTWDITAADIACRTIGVGPAVAPKADFTTLPTQFVARGITCIGPEDKLSDCQFDGLGTASCDDIRAVSLECSPFVATRPEQDNYLRLVAGSVPYEGRLEWYLNGTWRTICSNDWDLQDATVACRQLGYGVALEATTAFNKGRYTPKVVDNMACTGDEETLLDCKHGKWGECEPFTYYGDAGVVCNPFGRDKYHDRSVYIDHYPLRLTGGNSTNAGRLEIQVGGTWGTIAETSLQNWTLTAAHVACHQLGYDKATHAQWSNLGGEGSGPIHLTDVECNGNEGAIAVCSHSQFGVTDPALNHNHDIYIECQQEIEPVTAMSTPRSASTSTQHVSLYNAHHGEDPSPDDPGTVSAGRQRPSRTMIIVVVVCVSSVLGIIVGGAILYYKKTRARRDFPALYPGAIKL